MGIGEFQKPTALAYAASHHREGVSFAMIHGASGIGAPTPDPGMLIDVVDEHDRPIGTIERRQAIPAGVGFRVAHAFIFDHDRRLLLQQIGQSHSRHGDYWGSSVAAYLFSGESYEQAIVRRLAQELGIIGVTLRLVGKTIMNDEGARKFIELFSLEHSGPFKPDSGEIQAMEFVTFDQIRTMQLFGMRRFTPTLLHLLQFYQSLPGIP
jgi:isopentenyldiphosphate isomerase